MSSCRRQSKGEKESRRNGRDGGPSALLLNQLCSTRGFVCNLMFWCKGSKQEKSSNCTLPAPASVVHSFFVKCMSAFVLHSPPLLSLPGFERGASVISATKCLPFIHKISSILFRSCVSLLLVIILLLFIHNLRFSYILIPPSPLLLNFPLLLILPPVSAFFLISLFFFFVFLLYTQLLSLYL